MTSYEKEDMVEKMNGCEEDSDEFNDIVWKIWREKMYGCEEDSDKFDDIIWKGRYGGKKRVAVRIKPHEKSPGVKMAFKIPRDFENPLWVMFFNPSESSTRSLALL